MRQTEQENHVPPSQEEDNSFFMNDLTLKFKWSKYEGYNEQFKTAVAMLGQSSVLRYYAII